MSFIYRISFAFLFVTIIFIDLNSYGQGQPNSGIDLIQKLISEDKIVEAEKETSTKINALKSANKFDSVAQYIYVFGKIELHQSDNESLEKTILLADELRLKTTNLNSLFDTNLSLAKLFNEKGNALKAFEYAKIAKTLAIKLNDKTSLINANYYLSDFSLRLGNLNLFEKNTRSTYAILKENPTINFKIAARAYNYIGALMYLTSKPDSAIYFYEKALSKVDNMETKPENHLYLPATIKSNMVMLKQSQNKYIEAIGLIEESINLYNEFLKTTNNHPLEYKAQRNLSLAYRNLCSLYNDQRDFEKMNRIAELAYHYAKQNLPTTTLENFSAITLLAETKLSKNEPLKAIKYLNEAEDVLKLMMGDNFLLKANLYTIKGTAYYEISDFKKANNFYNLGEQFHEKAQPDQISRDRMFALINTSLSHAKLGEIQRANAILKEAYQHFFKVEENKSYLKNKILLALAKVNLIANNYQESLKWSEESLRIYNNNSEKNTTDKLHFEEDKAELLLLHTKAKYFLEPDKNISSLKKLLKNLEEAITVLEQRKSYIFSTDNINNLIEDNLEVFDFAKKINMELYALSEDNSYLNEVISLHESALYNRIRARLNLKGQIEFTDVPKDVLFRETHLRKELNNDLTDGNLDAFIKNTRHWDSFLDSLKQIYPKYYKMRYATLEQSLDNLQTNIPENTTVVRYLFIENKLYAFVVTKNEKEIFPLNFEKVNTFITQLNKGQFEVQKVNTELYELYKQLWKPFESKVTTENVIIIPDKELFNLSFEILTPQEINSFKELASISLLAKYNISYNYSLLLLGESRSTINYTDDFIAFVPEFTDKMKDDYKVAITDSIDLDKTYLTLLPQPFSKELVNSYSELFNGSLFTNENASKQIFNNNAKEHKIIHIGTHAESNNVNPELSRLIFAKNANDTLSLNDNSLYTYEIYNQNFSSNLAILTACETGKPSYQAGEGMISLAHAFNYAGSESILTSLWKIDEQSSSQLIKLFYDNLADGMPKDKALRKAKLDYISSAEGRTISPQYWAGLVLIGDASPIAISTSKPWMLWLIGLLIIFLLGYFVAKNLRK